MLLYIKYAVIYNMPNYIVCLYLYYIDSYMQGVVTIVRCDFNSQFES